MAVKMKFESVYCLLLFICWSYAQNETQFTTQEPEISTTEPAKIVPTGTSTTLQRNTDLAECTCDLTANGCDVECCCDSDCSEDDIQAFSRCVDKYTLADSQLCIKKNIILIKNVPYEINETASGLFCIQKDNYEERNYYRIPNTAETSDDFDTYLKTYGDFSYKVQSSTIEVPIDFYKSGDPVLVVYESLALGFLGLPRSLNSEICVDTNPSAFLYDESYECVRTVKSLENDCTTNPSLNGNTYFQNFKLVSTPNIFASLIPDTETGEATTVNYTTNTVTQLVTDAPSTVGTTEIPPLYNSSDLVGIFPNPPHLCMDKDGLNMTCNFTTEIPAPQYRCDKSTGNCYCHNVVIKVEYTIDHNGTAGILLGGIRFTFADVVEASLPLVQAFSTEFVKTGSSENVFHRSGNPGYKVGEPLLAGKRIQEEDIIRGTLHSIELDGNRNNWLTMVTSTATGECVTEPNNRLPVTFDEDMRSGCNIRVTFENMTSVCELIQDAVINALLGPNLPEYVGTFGNVAVENVGDWVPILFNNEPPGATASKTQPGVCLNVVLGMHIEVLYANVGALANPQAKVIGVAFQYDDPQEIRFQCIGPYCQPGTEGSLVQTLEVVSSVGFVDVSRSATAVTAEKPLFTAKLPQDFFYPFT